MAGSGSVRSIALDGTAFDVMASSNFTFTLSGIENDGVRHSGGVTKKMTYITPGAEGVEINTSDKGVRQALVDLNDQVDKFTISVTDAGGDVYVSDPKGFINFENHETEEGKGVVKVFVDSWLML